MGRENNNLGLNSVDLGSNFSIFDILGGYYF